MIDHRPRVFVLLALLALSFAQVRAQDAPAAPTTEPRERALQKARQQLDQKPTHAQLFDYYFKALVENNAVESEITALDAKLSKDAGQAATSIVLGRLYLRTGKESKALEVLDAIATKTPDVQGVLGDIYVKLGRHDHAARAFTAALPAAVTSEAKARLYEVIGKSQLALGQKDQAIATWQKLGALDDGKFHRRMRVAELLTQARQLAEAQTAYAPLLEETAGDPAQHCRVLREFGRLQELQGNLDPALATYDAILAATARGNWLRKEIEGRVVQIHRRQGKLDALVARLEAQRREQPDELAITELLADVYLETKKRDQAVAVLAQASPRFPNDLRLSRKLAQLYVDQGDVEKAIGEYQRMLTQKPDELEMYLELGQLFAKGAQFAEAKLQWEKALARRLQDATLCARLAGMYATFEREEDAVRLFERAMELEPDAMPRYTDLADYLFARGKVEPASAVLERAFVAAQGKPRRLEAIVGPLRERGLLERAQAALSTILELEPGNHETRYALADLLLERQENAPANALLWQIVDADDGTSADGLRVRAANTLVQLAAKNNTTDALAVQASQRAGAGAAFLLGRLHSRARDFDKAIASYRSVIDAKPQDTETRRLLARLLADQGEVQAALAEYDKIAQILPSEGKRQFREVARLYLETYDFDRAVEVWQKAMRDNPDNAAVFVEVGREFMTALRVPEALEAFQQAARLKANDPDILLRLADALRQAGKPDDAERALLELTTKAADPRDREQARSRLFDLFAEQGLIDQRIEALASKVAESPYDQDAPQLLADMYLRTGDYVLGLDMIDRALQFQQRNQELLVRRVEILEALEEWDKARLAHEELLKFPGAERDVHLAGIGQALYELGRAAEAKATFAKIQDRGRVADLYKKYELREEAIAFYQRAIGRFPGDVRNYVALAEQLMERNRNDDAVAALERALHLHGSHRRSLELLGKLYVQVGRRADAVQCGMRLFGLRGEETEKSRREEYEDEKNQRGSYGYAGGRGWSPTFNAQRVQAAQAFFTERGLQDEWGRILVAEAKRRPADDSLFNEVRSHYGWRDKSPAKLAAFVQELLARDWSNVRVPPSHTVRSYQQMLETTLLGVYRDDNATAQARVTELAGDGRPASELVERAWLQTKLGQAAAAEADLRQALTRAPEHVIAMTMLAELLLEAKQHAEAATWIERIAGWWQTPAGAAAQRDLDRTIAVQFQIGRRRAYEQFPRQLRRRVNDEFLRDMRQQTMPHMHWSKPSVLNFPEAAPPRLGALLKLIRTQRAAGDEAGLAKTIALATAEATTLAGQSTLGVTLFEEQRKAEAVPLLEAVLAREPAVKRDPLLAYAWSAYAPHFDEAARCLGQIYAEQGKVIEGYKLLRDHSQTQQAELVLRKQAKVEDVRALLEAGAKAAETKLRAERAGGARDLVATELDYRDEVIKFADFLLGEKEFAAVDALYQGSLTLLPDDLEIRSVLAALRLRQGEADKAIATHEDILAVKRRQRRAQQIDAVLPPSRLQPSLPDEQGPGQMMMPGVGRIISTSRSRIVSGSMSSGSRAMTTSSLEVAETYQQILEIYRQRNDSAGILATLTRIQREDPSTFRSMAYQVVNQVRNLDLGKDKMPILRALRAAVANNEWLMLEYGRACVDAGDLQEAKRSLEKLLTVVTAGNEYYTQEAERMLTTVAQRTGEAKLTLDDLRRKVDAEPDNTRHRTQLVAKLLDERSYEEALRHAEDVMAKAPHLALAKEQLIRAACAAGQDDRAREVMQKLFLETGKSSEKVQRGVAYANWLFADGKRDAAFAVIDDLEVQAGGTGNNQFSAGNWYLDRHELGRATKKLADELEKNKAQTWQADRIRPRLARTELASGAVVAAVARHLEAIKTAPSLGDREQRFKELLGALTGSHAPQALVDKLGKHAGRASVEDLLVMTALDFARGDGPAATADIEQALDLSSKEVYLFPLLYGLRKLRGDYEGALAVLERMSTSWGGSDTVRWTGGNTGISEKDQITVERAALLDDLDRAADGDAAVESIYDATKPATMLTVAHAMKERKRFDQALEWRRKYFEQAGQRDADALCDEAEILLEQKQLDAAMALLAQAQLMAKGHARARTLSEQLHRRRGTLPELIATLEKDYEKDPRSAPIRDQLVQLYGELRRYDARKSIYVRMLDDPATKVAALEALIGVAERDNDRAQRVELLQQLLLLKGGEEKKQVHGRLSQAFVDAGQLDHAQEQLRLSIQLDTAAGQVELGQWLRRNGGDDRAGAAFAKALELDPDHEEALSACIEDAWRAKDWPAFLDRTFKRMDRASAKGYYGNYVDALRLLDALAALAAAERAQRLSGEGDLAAKEQAAFLHAARGDDTRARQLFTEVLAVDPRRAVELEQMGGLAARDGQPEEALAYAKRLHDVVERQHVVRADWNARWRTDSLWRSIGQWQHALGDSTAAEATFRTPSLRRSPISAGSGSYRYDWDVPYAAERWLEHDEPARALAALDREFLMHESPPWDTYWRALCEADRRADAEQNAWQRLLDPLRLYGVREQSQTWMWDEMTGESAPSEPSIQFLVASYRKRGAFAELKAKGSELAARPESRLQAEELRRAVIAAGDDWREKAQLAEQKLIDDESNANARMAAAVCRARAGDADQAIAHLSGVFDLESEALRQPARAASRSRDRTYQSIGNRPTHIAGKKNPFSFSFETGGSSTTSYSSSYDDFEGRRPMAVVILTLAGRGAKAQEVERDLIEQAPAGERRMQVCQSLASKFASVRLYADALRLYGLARDQMQARERFERTYYDQQFLQIAKRCGDEQLKQTLLALERARLEKAVEAIATEGGGRPGFPERQALAGFLIDQRVDPQAGLALLDALAVETGRAETFATQRALALRLVGRGKEAVAIHDGNEARARKLNPKNYKPGKPVDRIEVGLALAAAGETARAKAILEPALAEMHRAPRASGDRDYEYYGGSYTRAFEQVLVDEVEAALRAFGG